MPTVYSSPRQYVGLAVEPASAQGTAVTPPAVTIPVTAFDPFDQPTFIDASAEMRGALTGPFNRVAGPDHTEFSISGAAYFDTIGYLLSNIFGDLTYSGTYTGSGTTTLSSPAAISDVSISTVATIPNGTTIQISTDNSSEVRVTTGVSGGGPFVVTFTPGLARTHAAAQVVRPITTPFTQTYNVLNSGNGQMSSLTITDYQGTVASTGTRQYTGCCLSELNIKGTAESSAITFDGSGMGWPSAAATAFTPVISTVKPQPAWEMVAGLAGPASGGTQVKTINDWSLAIKRELQIYYTGQNLAVPYQIVRGRLTASGTFNFVAADDTPQTYLTSNTQPQFQEIVSNGLSGASLLSMQIDAALAAFSTSKISRGSAAVEFSTEWDAIANTTNVGNSAGYGPVSITMQNAVAANTF